MDTSALGLNSSWSRPSSPRARRIDVFRAASAIKAMAGPYKIAALMRLTHQSTVSQNSARPEATTTVQRTSAAFFATTAKKATPTAATNA